MITRRDLLISVPAGAALGAARRRLPVGAQQNAWRDPADFEGLLAQLEILKRLGFEGFETNVRNVQGQFASAEKARERLKATGLRFIGPHTNIKAKPGELERIAEGSKALGAERLVVSGGVPKEGADEAIASMAKTLNTVGRYTRKLGMRVIYHNHQTEFVSNGAPMESLLGQTDPGAVFLLFDTGHAYLQKIDLPAFLEKHGKRVDSMHLRDIKAGKQVPLGEGELDLKGIAATVKRTGWSGWLIDETEMRTPDSALAERVVASNRKVIRGIFGV